MFYGHGTVTDENFQACKYLQEGENLKRTTGGAVAA